MAAIATQYLTTYEQPLLLLYQRSLLLIQEDSTLSHEEKNAATEELQIHERPILSMLPQSQFTASMEVPLTKSREKAKLHQQPNPSLYLHAITRCYCHP